MPFQSVDHGSHIDWKMGKHFPVGEKSQNFEQTGKVRAFYPKYWKSVKEILVFIFL